MCCMCVCTHAVEVHVCEVRTSCWSSFPVSTLWVPEIKLRSPSLAISTVSLQAICPLQLALLSVLTIYMHSLIFLVCIEY